MDKQDNYARRAGYSRQLVWCPKLGDSTFLSHALEVVPMPTDRNVFGTELEPCSTEPMTGYLRDGCCHAVESDVGRHEVCAIMTEEFLTFSKAQGNDLITPRPEFAFPGLEPGDRWCLCLPRWVEAHQAGHAPPVILEATHEAVLDELEPNTLRAYEYGRGGDDDSAE